MDENKEECDWRRRVERIRQKEIEGRKNKAERIRRNVSGKG